MANPYTLLKNLIGDFYKFQGESLAQSRELDWAHVYHDSIRGKRFLEDLGLNVGRWAGNYSFFYILHRVLSDYKPKAILELGLGESTKMISAYLSHELNKTRHTVVEQDQEWIRAFSSRFTLTDQTQVVNCPLASVQIKGFPSYAYSGFSDQIQEDYDLYIVDGPFGSDRFSRFDVVALVEKFNSDKEFILIMDDTHRRGEQDTVGEILTILEKKKIRYYTGDYSGNKQNTLIATEKYRFATSF